MTHSFIETESGRKLEIQKDGETVWSREEERQKIKEEAKKEIADALENSKADIPKEAIKKIRGNA